jgi:hypothetical protein
VLHVLLHQGVGELLADQALGVVDGVQGVLSDLVLGGVADQTLLVGEGDLRGGGLVALVVGDDLHVVVSENGHTRLSGS